MLKTAKSIPATSLQQKFSLKDQVAVITGGAGMLGIQHAEAVAELGGIAILMDHSEDNLQKAVPHLTELFGNQIVGVHGDVTEKKDIEAVVQTALKKFGRIDILINNSSMTVKGGTEKYGNYFAPFEEYPLELWQKALHINLSGLFLCTQRIGKVMCEQKKGVIVNIASVAGVVGPDHRIYQGIKNQYGGPPFNTPISYTATKSAIVGMTRYLATYWAPFNIRINSLSPGGVYDGHDETFVKNYTYRVPLGRMANRDEYKGAIAFLASDASSYMTGSNLIIDGGWTAW